MVAALLATAASLGGCDTLYLYNSKTDAATAQIKSDFAALKAPAYLDQQHTLAITFNTEEDTAVAALSTAARNAALVDIVRPSPLAAGGEDSVQLLRTQVEARLAQLYRPGPWTDAELTALGQLYALSVQQDQVGGVSSDVAAALRNFEAARPAGDKRPTDCATVGAPPPAAAPAPAAEADIDYVFLQTACDEQAKHAANDLAFPLVLAPRLAASQLNVVVAEYQKARQDQQAELLQGRRLAAQIQNLQKAASAAPDPSALDQALTEAETAARTLNSAPPLARALGLQAISQTLEPALAHALSPTTPLPAGAPADSKAVAASLVLLRDARQAATDFEAAPDESKGDALLIAVAELSHQQKDAQLQASWDARRVTLRHAEVVALFLEAEQLVRAEWLLTAQKAGAPSGFAELRTAAQPGRRRMAEALTAYSNAWDVGETPYWVLKFKEVQYNRLAALERAEQTESDYRAVMAPAVDVLAAAGAGGVKPETWATLLGDLGIAGAIVGK